MPQIYKFGNPLLMREQEDFATIIVDEHDLYVAVCYGPQRKNNAKQIVEANNRYNRLIEICQEVLQCLSTPYTESDRLEQDRVKKLLKEFLEKDQ